MLERNDTREGVWTAVIGTSVGMAAAAATLWWSSRRDGDRAPELEQSATERRVRMALRSEEGLGRRGTMVSEVGPGVVELTGFVKDEAEAERAVALVQGVEGVSTVVNRLTARDLEKHLRETQQRFRSGDAALHETHWTGMGVGMGRRRQSAETDPGTPDDHAKLIERSLDPRRVAEREGVLARTNGNGNGDGASASEPVRDIYAADRSTDRDVG